MGGEKDRRTALAQFCQISFHLVGGSGVQAYKGLIQNQQPGPADKGGNQGQLLPHSVGIAANGRAQVPGQLKGIAELGDTGGALLRRNVIQVGNEIEKVDSLHKLVQVRIVGQEGRDPLGPHRVLFDVVAVNENGPLCKVHHPRHGPQGGGLARSVVADEAINLAGLDVEAQVVYRPPAPWVGLGIVFYAQHCTVSFQPKHREAVGLERRRHSALCAPPLPLQVKHTPSGWWKVKGFFEFCRNDFPSANVSQHSIV